MKTLEQILQPYLQLEGIVDLEKYPLHVDFSHQLECFINAKMAHIASNFCNDGVVVRQLEVSSNALLKIWGHTYWLGRPINHIINKSGKDPFYCEIVVSPNQTKITSLYFGDYGLLNIDKYWSWFDLDIDWIYHLR